MSGGAWDERAKAEALDELASAIVTGRCVAFVGAGFSGPVCRLWSDLLAAVAAEVKSSGTKEHVEALLAQRSARGYEMAAQILEDAFKDEPTDALLDSLRRHTRRSSVSEEAEQQMARRRKLLLEIPFAAVLTTNFDDELQGEVLDSDTYASLLRESGSRWLEKRFWSRSSLVLKLHGDLQRGKGVTLSRRGYRTRLYTEPGYLHVLRSVLLTKTVLFLGFSFTDEYLNELRSEVLAYLAPEGKTPRFAYALLNDVPNAMHGHFRDHEAIHVFEYKTDGVAKDHRGFDEFLETLNKRTNPDAIMGDRLANKRILWIDPNEHHNTRGREQLAEATRGLRTVDLAMTPDEAFAKLQSHTYDLVISRWGHQPHGSPADAVALLEWMRTKDVRVPVVIFASGHFARANREAALRLGALEYTSNWPQLFAVIDRRFSEPAGAR